MKYYVKCKECGAKIYFTSDATIRSQLPFYFNLKCFQGHEGFFNSWEVTAEPRVSGFNAGTILGGIIGGAARAQHF
jgi:hypothetical protein